MLSPWLISSVLLSLSKVVTSLPLALTLMPCTAVSALPRLALASAVKSTLIFLPSIAVVTLPLSAPTTSKRALSLLTSMPAAVASLSAPTVNPPNLPSTVFFTVFN